MPEIFTAFNNSYTGTTKEKLKEGIKNNKLEAGKKIKIQTIAAQTRVTELGFNQMNDQLVLDEFDSYDTNKDGTLSENETKKIDLTGNAVTDEDILSSTRESVTGKSEKEVINTLSKNTDIMERLFLATIARFFKDLDSNKNGIADKAEVDKFLKQKFPIDEIFVEYGIQPPPPPNPKKPLQALI